MRCDGCKINEAQIVLHMMTNGQVATRSLCSECAQKAHTEMTKAFATMGMQVDGLQHMVERAREQRDSIPRMICSNCRTAFTDIGYDTVFGCPSCYKAFHQQVVTYLTDLRPKEAEAEAVPDTLPPLPAPTMEELDARLAEALQAEDYEQAAALRDQIKAMTVAGGEVPDA